MKKLIVIFFILTLFIIHAKEDKGKVIAKEGQMTIYDKYDEWVKLRTISTGLIRTLTDSGLYSWYFRMKMIYLPEAKNFLFQIEYLSNTWVFIEKGNSLKLKIGDEVIDLYTNEGSANHRDSSFSEGFFSGVREVAFYEMSDEVLKKIIEVQGEINMRVYGSSGYIKVIIKEAHKKYFKLLYDTIMAQK